MASWNAYHLKTPFKQEDQKKFADENFTEKNGDMGDVPKIKLGTKKMLKGHINKVTTCHFAGDSR